MGLEEAIGTSSISALAVAVVAHIVWDIYKSRTKKEDDRFERLIEGHIQAMTKNTEAQHESEYRFKKLERDLSEIPRMKDGIRKIFNLLRYQAGDQWPKLKKIMEDDLET